jgi:hypothetical protein
MNDGVLPWWADPRTTFAFFRPLASATHVADHLLFPGNAFLMHLHSVAWSMLALLGLRSLFGAVFGEGFVATLALCLYALDDARGSPVTWVANRNEIVGCALSIWAMVFYLRSRAGDRRAAWLGPAAMVASLLASEGSIAITAYLFAHALFVDEGPLGKRLLRLWPFATVVVAWAAVYHALGFGISRSGVYFDPAGDPIDFLRFLPERFTALWMAQLGGPWSEGWNAYPVLAPGLEHWMEGLAVVVIAGALLLFMPLLKADKVARFWLLGAALGSLPACGAFPADRLLPWMGIGAMAITAQFFDAVSSGRLGGAVARGGAAAVVFCHLFAGPLLLPIRAWGIANVRAALDRADVTVPSGADVEARVAIYLNPAADPFASYIPITRAALGTPRPRAQRWLASGATDLQVSRVDPRTLRVRQVGGFLPLPSERLFRNTRLAPFKVGEVISLAELEVTITEVTTDGRPAEILARLDAPLEDPKYLWFAWQGTGYVPWKPPATPGAETLPKADFVAISYGSDSAITKAIRGAPSAVAAQGGS